MATLTTANLQAALLAETQLLQIALEQNFARQNMKWGALRPGAMTFTRGVQMKELALKFFPAITAQTIKTQTQIQHASATRSANILTDLLGEKVNTPDLQEVLKVSTLSNDSLEALARHSLDSANFWNPANFSTDGLTATNMLKSMDSMAITSSTFAHYMQVKATGVLVDGKRFKRERVLSAGACDFCILMAEIRNYKSFHGSCGCSVIQIPVLD